MPEKNAKGKRVQIFRVVIGTFSARAHKRARTLQWFKVLIGVVTRCDPSQFQPWPVRSLARGDHVSSLDSNTQAEL